MDSKALELHSRATVVVGHDHTTLGIAMRRERGERAVFSNHYIPLIYRGGVNVIGLVVGGDRPSPLPEGDSPWWRLLSLVDMLWQEVEESGDTTSICLNGRDIDTAITEGKIALLMTMEGARPLSQSLLSESLVPLRTLCRLGIRGIQLIGGYWNPLVDAPDDAETTAGLTGFGKAVVQEMNRLGMVIDVAHVPDPDPMFWDVIEVSQDPVIDSHHSVRAVNDIPSCLSDERIKAIARKGGVIGMHFASHWVNEAVEQATLDDLVRHIDHIVELVGVDHVGLGPDFAEVELVGLVTDEYYVKEVTGLDQLPRVTEALVERGYSDADILKILGENLLRVYRQVIG